MPSGYKCECKRCVGDKTLRKLLDIVVAQSHYAGHLHGGDDEEEWFHAEEDVTEAMSDLLAYVEDDIMKLGQD